MGDDLLSLELRCLGPTTARVGGGDPPPDVVWRKHLGLLAYLALSPGLSRSREHLLGMFWPEKPVAKARHSLNEAVRRLRVCLGAERLLSEGESIRLSDAALDVDVLNVAQVADEDPAEALTMLRGEFLEGLTLEDAPGFEEWVAVERRRLQALTVSLCLAIGEEALAANAFDAAETAGQRALDVEPYSEAAASLLLRARALAGDATGALAAYRAFRQRTLEDLREEPGREIQTLAERVRSQRWRRASPAYQTLEPPLVGRVDTHRRVFSLMEDGVRSGARCLLIAGNPGMGRTRLLNECAERLALSGASIVTARPLENDADAPWSTLRVLGPGLASMPGVAAAPPRALAVLADLVPEFAERVSPATPRDTSEVASALGAVLRAIAEEQPLGILIDDADLADGSSVGALAAVQPSLGAARIVLVLTVDATAAVVPRELAGLQADIGRRIVGETVFLHPFGDEEMRGLVTALATWCGSEEMVDRLARRLVLEAGGTPFYAVTLLRGLDRMSTLKDDLLMWPRPAATMETPLPFSVPNLARLAITGRVAEVDAEAAQVLRAASIGGGRALDVQLVAALVELPVERVEAALDRLEQAHFVRFDGSRYAFVAQVVAGVVRGECMPSGQRQRLRRRAIEVLAGRDDLESRLARVEILAKLDRTEATYREAISFAEDALAAGSMRMASRALYAAESTAVDEAARNEVERLRRELPA